MKDRLIRIEAKDGKRLTDTIIEKLNQRDKPVIFVLWGKPAQQKSVDRYEKAYHHRISPSKSVICQSWFLLDQNHFQKINQALIALG